MRKLDLLLIQPGSLKKNYQSLAQSLSAVEPPIWALLTAGLVKKHGFSVQILDSQAMEFNSSETTELALQKNPRLIAIPVFGHNPSASTQMMPSVREICRALKSAAPEIPILLFGGHPSALPEKTLLEETTDFVSQGEGPATILGLLGSEGSHYARIPDLWYRAEGRALRSLISSPLNKNLDEEFPELSWELLPMEKYRAHNWHCFGGISRTPYAAIYTTLGCPYHCEFCCIQSPFRNGEKISGPGTRYRFWSPAWVLNQIDILVQKFGVRNIKIADEMFVLNTRHVMEICKGLITRNYGLNLWAYARVDTAKDSELLGIMKKAGFNWLVLGIEAADEETRNGVEKRFTQQDIFDSVERIQGAGISVLGNYIFGLPGENLQSMQRTLDLAGALNTEFANFYCAMAYPGSVLYETALNQGWALPEDWEGYSQLSKRAHPLAVGNLSACEILEFRDQAFHTYFNRPDYQSLLQNKFGAPSLDEINQMLSFSIDRLSARRLR